MHIGGKARQEARLSVVWIVIVQHVRCAGGGLTMDGSVPVRAGLVELLPDVREDVPVIAVAFSIVVRVAYSHLYPREKERAIKVLEKIMDGQSEHKKTAVYGGFFLVWWG